MKAAVKITAKDIRSYMFYTIYHSPSGIASVILGFLTIGGGIFYLVNGSKTGIFFLIMAVVFFVLQPLMILMQAKSQSKNPVFTKETLYTFDEQGITAGQEGVEPASIQWQNLYKVVKSGNYFFIFFDKVRANILPREAFEAANGATQFEKLLVSVLPEKKRKGIR